MAVVVLLLATGSAWSAVTPADAGAAAVVVPIALVMLVAAGTAAGAEVAAEEAGAAQTHEC